MTVYVVIGCSVNPLSGFPGFPDVFGVFSEKKDAKNWITSKKQNRSRKEFWIVSKKVQEKK